MTILLGLLTNRWVQLALAVVATAIFVGSWQRYEGYSKEHKARLQEVAELNDIITKGAIKAFKINEQTTAALVASEEKLKKNQEILTKKNLEIKKRINENKALFDLILPPDAVSLHDESTSNSTDGGQAARLKAPAGTTADANTTSGQGISLGRFLEVATDNNLNHEAAIGQIKELQTFICELYDADGQPLTYPVCNENKKKE